MNTAFPVPADAAPAPRLIGLRILLGVVALLEAYQAFSSLPFLFPGGYVPGSSLGDAIIRAHQGAHPVLALAALLLAAIGRVRDAIIVLGALVFTTWLNLMPSVVRHGLDFDGFYAALTTSARIIAFPLMAACAIAYAARGERPWTAAMLVSFPTLFNIADIVVGLVVFFIGVMIYGF